MGSFSLFLESTFQVICSLLLFIGIGFIPIKLLKIQLKISIFSIFLITWVGQLLFTILGALYFTHGKTILVLALPIVFYFLLVLKNKPILIESKNSFKTLLIYFLASIIIISLWNHLKYYNHELNKYYTSNTDFPYYAKVSDYLVNVGIERNDINFITENKYVTPYHYYDLWLNGLLGKLFQINYVAALTNITYTVNYIIIFLGILTLLEYLIFILKANDQNNQNKLVLFLITILTFFLSAFYHPSFRYFVKQIDIVSIDIFKTPKLFPIYITCIFIYFSIIFKNHGLFFLSLILCGLLYPTTIPAFYSISFLIILFDYFLIKKIKNHFNYLVLLMLSAMFYIIFYKFTGNNIKNDTFLSSLLQIKINLADLIIVFIIPFATIFFVLVLYFPYLLLIIKSKILFDKFYIKNSFYFMIVILAISVSVWAVGNKAQNSVQLFYNPFTPVLHVFLYLSILTVYLFADKKWIYITTLILLVNVSVNSGKLFFDRPLKWDKQFNLQVTNAIQNKNHLGAFIYNPKLYQKYKSNYFFKVYPVSPPLCNLLASIDTKFHPICISIYDMVLDSTSKFFPTEKLLVQNSEFYQFVETQKKNNEFKSIPQSQLDFIKKYNIEWLITDSETILPNEIKKLVVQEFSSETYHTKFYLLNPSKSN